MYKDFTKWCTFASKDLMMKILPPYLTVTLILFLYFIPAVQAQNQFKINAFDGAANDQMGSATAVSGNRMIAGAKFDNNVSPDCGSAYIYTYDGSSWSLEQKINANDADTSDNFGTAVDIEGDLAVVGDNLDDTMGNSSGAAYIFRFNGTTWVQEQKLVAGDGQPGDEFGYSVSISNDVVIVGAYKDDFSGLNTGSAYVFRYNGSTWVQEQKLNAIGPSPDDYFGYAVSVYNNVAVVGLYLDDDLGINSGSAFVFRYNGSTWVNEQKLTASNGAVGDAFGYSVSNSDTIIAIGAYARSKDAFITASGGVYVFKYNGTNWTQTQLIQAPDAADDDWFGFAVSLSKETIITGAFHDDDLGAESGSAYVHRYNGNTWIYEFKLKASDGDVGDELALCVAVDDFIVACGAPKNDDNGSNSGSVYTFDLCTYTPVRELCLTTVDTLNNNDLLIWSKPNTTFIDSFLVYRTIAGVDTKVGAVDYKAFSEFNDTGINPDNEAGEYFLITLNVCGNESAGGVHHKVIRATGYVNAQNKTVLNWTPSSGFTFPYYRIYRDDNADGNWQLIAANLNTQFTYTDNTIAADTNVRYIVEVQKTAACSSGNLSLNYALSNIVQPYINPSSTGINEWNDVNYFTVYPNPFGEEILNISVINPGYEKNKIALFDVAGRLIALFEKEENVFTYDFSFLQKGIYVLRVNEYGRLIVKK